MHRDVFETLVEKDYKIFVDTSSLMQEDSEFVFFKIIAPLLDRHSKQLIVPKSVLNEISKHNYNKHKDIQKANHILEQLSNFKLWGTNSKFDEQFADNAISSQFHSLRLKYNLCLITNDNSHKKDGNLSQDILDLRKSRSSENIKDIRVFFIKNQGLVEFKEHTKKNDSTTKTQNISTDKANKQHFKFNLPQKPHLDDKVLPAKSIPSVNDFVIDNNSKKHKLLKQIGRTGGEGAVYLTDTDFICKIYKQDKLTKFRKEKIELLIRHSIKVKNVCLPECIVYNNFNEFIGYLMPQASGSEIKTSIFIPPLFKQKFPTWDRLHLAKTALNILKKVEKLHQYNIILGDINPSNILLNNENDIYFIDTDSFQIDGYPCGVGMVPYTRKIHHGKKYTEYLRTKEDDIFAVTTLVFQLMLPGKLPYSFCGGGAEKDNMQPENFPYKCYDGAGYNNAPDGQWVYIWSHLPKKLKELFCQVFKKNKAISLDDLMENMKNYIHQLEQGYQTKDIFPLTHKQVDSDGKIIQDGFTEFKCKICNSSFALTNNRISEFKAKGWKLPTKCDICKDIKDPDLKQCANCKKPFKDKYNTLCANCRGATITCNSCYSTFLFSENERDFYNKKGLNPPKKCIKCRGNKKNHSGSGSNSSNSNSSGSFLSSLIGFLLK